MVRWFALVPLLPLSGLVGSQAVDWAARPIAQGLGQAAALWAPAAAAPAEVYVEADVDAAAADPTRIALAPQAALMRSAAVPRKGVRVSAGRVLALANAGARPSGVFVPARGARPAGLALTGVSALGVGLIDGDVLTHAGGRPASSAAAVVGMVLGARARGLPELSGRFWRNGESWNLIVEQPYVRRSPERKRPRAFRAPSTDTGRTPIPSTARPNSARP
ncbi:MAG: hypothetical protein R3B13_09370 [Polyangiaceae bacterium]